MAVKKKIKRNTTKKKMQRRTVKKDSRIKKEKKKTVPVLPESEVGKKDQIVYARARFVPGSARKARLVVDRIRDMNALNAIDKLMFVNKYSSGPIKKVIQSAVSNAVHNFEMEEKKLVIVKAFIDEAPVLKRGRAGSRGRYKKILKRNCHITIGVQEK
jgi:large subunit ribosomal protein L22